MEYSVYIIHFSRATRLQYWPNNIMYTRVSYCRRNLTRRKHIYILYVKMFHSGVILYYYCRIDEDRNIVYSRTHIQIVKQYTIQYIMPYILYTALTAIYEQKHCRFTNTNFQSSLISYNITYIDTTMVILFLNGFVDRVLDFKHWTHVCKNLRFQ